MSQNARSIPTPALDCPRARCRAFLESNTQDHGGPVALAVSGGMDSMVLLHAFHEAAEDFGLPRSRILVLHVNHGLRSGASADENFVREAALKLGLAVACLQAQISRHEGGSLEARARRARYSLIYAAMKKAESRWLLTAHHRDDQAETIMLQHMRGTDLLGLGGMPATRFLVAGRPQKLHRPFLELGRPALEDWARSHGVVWRDDLSNRSLAHRRNLVRHLVLPQLEKRGLHRDELWAFSRQVQESMGTIVRLAILAEKKAGIAVTADAGGQTLEMPLDVLQALPAEVAFHLLERRLNDMGAPAGSLTHHAFARIVTAEAAGDVLELRRNLHVRILSRNGRLILEVRLRRPTPDDELCSERPLPVPTSLTVKGLGVLDIDVFDRASPRHVLNEIWLPLSAVRGSLVLRPPRQGERMQPFGMSGTRLIADLLREARIPKEERWRRPLVADDAGPLWLPGIRPSERCRIRDDVGRFLRLRHVPEA